MSTGVLCAAYTAALAFAVFGLVRVAGGSTSTLAYVAPLIGILIAVAAGVQQLDKQRMERTEAATRQQDAKRLEIAQNERESVRRFDERFAATMKASTEGTDEARMGAAAGLMSFLREDNGEFQKQTYDFVLSYLKTPRNSYLIDHAFVRVFQSAARLVIPALAGYDHRQAVDLAFARLDSIDLTNLELAEADLTETLLTRADLTGACLWRAHGVGTDLTGASLRHANLEEMVLLGGLKAHDADFSYANLVAARFAPRGRQSKQGGSNFSKARFTGARLQGACFNDADLTDAHFDRANLRGASFRRAYLNEAAVHTILRATNETWRYANWDHDIRQLLVSWRNYQDYVSAGTPRVASATFCQRRKPSDVPPDNYRRHPHPGHINHAPRRRLVQVDRLELHLQDSQRAAGEYVFK